MIKPDWKDAPEWANWMAMDEDGEWFWYEHRPITWGDGVWIKVEGEKRFIYSTPWIDTLQERPEEG